MYQAVREIRTMLQQAVEMVKQAVADGKFLRVKIGSAIHDINLVDAITFIEGKSVWFIKRITISDNAVTFLDGSLGILMEDPDDYNADASNHVTGE
jgi:hypothetical protein